MWLKKLKFKKLQYILMAILIIATSMIFSATVSYVFEVNSFVSNFYSKDCMPNYVCMAAGDGFEKIKTNDELFAKMKDYTVYNGKTTIGVVKLNNQTFSASSLVFPIDNKDNLVYRMELLNDNTSSKPGFSEIWIPYTFADSNGIKIGDKLTLFDKGTYTVTAFCITPVTTSVFSIFNPFFVSTEDYSKFDDEANYELIFTDLVDGSNEDDFFELVDFLGDMLQGGSARDDFAASDTRTTNISGNIGIVGALIMFIAALIVIGYIIRSNVLKEYNNIGIYKSLGFSDKKIKRIYFTGYILIAFISAAIGILLGFPVGLAMGKPVTKYMGTLTISFISGITGIVSLVALTLLTFICLSLMLRKINKIKPIEALNVGLTSSVKKLKQSVIKNARSPLSLSVNEIFKYFKNSMITVVLITSVLLLTFIFASINNSISYMDKKSAAYFAIPEGDAYITSAYSGTSPAIYEDIEASADVKDVIIGTMIYESFDIDGKTVGSVVMQQNNFDPSLTKMPYVKGREPRSENEVALNVGLLKDFNLSVDDYVQIDFANVGTKTYLIVGSFSAMVANRYIVQITDTVRPIEKNAVYLCIYLNNGVDFEEFKLKTEGEYNVFVSDKFPDIGEMAQMIIDIMSPTAKIMMALFVGFAFLIIVNMLFMNYLDNKKSFGTLKCLGVSTKHIALKNLFKILILTVASILIALLISSIFGPILYKFIVGNNSFVYSADTTFLLIGVVLAIVTLATLLFAIPISKIKPKDLMEE